MGVKWHRREMICPTCDGDGYVARKKKNPLGQWQPFLIKCKTCKGSGEVNGN